MVVTKNTRDELEKAGIELPKMVALYLPTPPGLIGALIDWHLDALLDNDNKKADVIDKVIDRIVDRRFKYAIRSSTWGWLYKLLRIKI
jgi:hypothetical protein